MLCWPFEAAARSMDNSLRRIPALPRRCSQLPACALLTRTLLTAALAAVSASAAHATDTINPAVTITDPANNANVSSWNAASGTASDDTALKQVNVYLSRTYGGLTKEYLDPSTGTWKAAGTAFPVTTSPALSGNPTSTSWSIDGSAAGFSWPSATVMPPGKYNVEARSVDTSNRNSSLLVRPFSTGNVDSTVPNAAFATPSADVTADTFPTSWNGTVQDETGGSGIGYARLSLTRKISATTEYWNGSGWTATATYKVLSLGTPDANGAQTWSYTLGAANEWAAPTGNDLPSAKYTMTLTVYDRYLNAKTVTRIVNIVPVDTTAPQIELGSPVAESVITTAPASFTGTCWDPLSNGSASGVAYALLSLSRTWGSTSYTWNGNAWVTNGTNLPLTLGQPTEDANGADVYPWTFSSVPPAAQLTQGKYTIRIFVYDRYGNSVNVFRNFYVAPEDHVPPQVAFTAPADNAALTALPAITGTVSDDNSGISRLDMALWRWRGGMNEYWNGTSWTSASAVRGYPTIGTPDANGVITWDASTAYALPSGANLPPGKYSLNVTAGDRYLNTASVTQTVTITTASGVVDVSPPSVTVNYPAEGAVLESLGAITGSAAEASAPAADQTGLSDLRVRLIRVLPTGDVNWTGSAWQSATAFLSPRTLTGMQADWSRGGVPSGANLPTGQYKVVAGVSDQCLNASPDVTVNFFIGHKPAAQAQSVTATGRLNTEGDPASITLTATDADNDAIQSWRIIDQPGHGTLTGTAPNLTYIADQGYFGGDSFTFAASDLSGESDPATVNITVSAPPPVDVLIKNPSDPSYTGDNITSTDGTNETVAQTVFAGNKAIYHLKLQKESATSSVVLRVVGSGGSAGWTVRYYDAQTNGLDITDGVTSADGWQPILTGDASFRVEVTPPAGLAAETNLDLLIGATVQDSSTLMDVVKATTVGLPAIQPDLEVKLDDAQAAYVGDDVLNATGAGQSVTHTVAYNAFTTAGSYLVRVRNQNGVAGPVTLKGPAGAGDASGWNLTYQDAQAVTAENPTGDVTGLVTDETGYTVQVPESGERVLKLTVAATLQAKSEPQFLIAGTSVSNNVDTVKVATSLPQYIAGLEYSLDDKDTTDTSKTWTAVTGPVIPVPVVQGHAISLRAIPGKTVGGTNPWGPENDGRGPRWYDQRNNYTTYGGATTIIWSVSTGGGEPASFPVTVHHGNEFTVGVQVIPYLELDLYPEIDSLVSGGTGDTSQTELVAKVTNISGYPVSGVTVRFSFVSGDGQINEAGTTDDVAVTNSKGFAVVTLHAGSANTSARLRAAVDVPPGMVVDGPSETVVSYE